MGPRQLGHLLRHAAASLAAQGAQTPRLDAEVLLAHVRGVDRAYLLAHPDEAVEPAVERAFGALVARRSHGEPVAYLTGRRDWYGLSLRVTPAVLVPRPETEGVLERALAWACGRKVGAAVDVGTGSGALAIGLARALPDTTVYATDVSEVALAVARENAAVHGAARIIFLQGDLLAPLAGPVDLLVANLPYIGSAESAALSPDVRLYEPAGALVGGPLGHELIARLLWDAPAYLRPGGAMVLELGPAQAPRAAAAAAGAFPTAAVRVERDYAGLERYLVVAS